MIAQTACTVQTVLDKALLADPDASVWFLVARLQPQLLPVAGVAACRRAGGTFLLCQHPAVRAVELVEELSQLEPDDAACVLLPFEAVYAIRWAEYADGILFLGGGPDGPTGDA